MVLIFHKTIEQNIHQMQRNCQICNLGSRESLRVYLDLWWKFIF